jgi:hypothetical protein
VRPEPTDALEQVWAGEGCPVGASKAVPAGYRNRIERTPKTGDIDITVVCNDEGMTAELHGTDDIYGSRDDLDLRVTDRRSLSVDELAEVLRSDADFLHYVGHIDEGGFECHDGHLDVRELDRIGVDAFLLNACRSYRQGVAMLERGSFGGVVTLSDVSNAGAVGVGRLLARLLNVGFPVRSALNIVREHSFVGNQYIAVGDGGGALTQFTDVYPSVRYVERAGDEFLVREIGYPPTNQAMGATRHLDFGPEDQMELIVGESRLYRVDESTVREHVVIRAPVVYEGELVWSADEIEL